MYGVQGRKHEPGGGNIIVEMARVLIDGKQSVDANWMFRLRERNPDIGIVPHLFFEVPQNALWNPSRQFEWERLFSEMVDVWNRWNFNGFVMDFGPFF